ncbi:MAG: tetratricopeptide repeat protein [Woeseia sp.]
MNSKTVDLNPARWARVELLFEEAASLPSSERAGFLQQQCDDDVALRTYVLSLLESDSADSTQVSDSIRDVLDATLDHLDYNASMIGTRIGPYRISQVIGSGGMGVVYLAERADDEYKQKVAIKVVRQRLLDPDVGKRLLGERQILANLDHPNIAKLFDGGTTEEGTPYLVMEYIEGVPIDEYCDQNRLTVSQRLALFRTVCAAIHHAHRNLVVHRDIKPSNILVTHEGTPKLLDFGIARLLDAENNLTDGLTRAGAVMMTPENAAPEQVSNGPITTATDTYALGILLYRLVTACLPYTINLRSPRDIPRIICESNPSLPSQIVRDPGGSALNTSAQRAQQIASLRGTTVERLSRQLRGDIDNIVQMAMRKEPERRYRSVNEFAEDIRRHLESHPVLARPDTWRYRSSRMLRRHRAGAAMTASLIALLIAFATMVTLQNQRIAEERNAALEVSTFLEEIFREPDPGNARGANVTAREILAKGAARVQTELQDRPAIKARLMSTIGRVYYNLGEYDRSIEMLEQSLQIRRELLGDESSEVAATQNELAVSLTRKADYERAEKLLNDALAQNQLLHGAQSQQVAGNLFNLAELYQATGKQELAAQYARDAITIYLRLAQTQPTELAEAMSLLSRILQWRNELTEAEQLQRDAIAIVEKNLGANHPLLAYYKQNLAILVQSNGNLADAELLFNEAIAATRETLGAEHSLLGGSFVMLGRLLQQQERFDEAEEAFRNALRLHRSARGDTHPYVAYDKVSLGSLLRARGDLAAAEAELRDALRIYELTLPENHQYIASGLTELGAVLTADGRAEEAEALLRRAANIRRRDYDENHPLLATTLAVAGWNLSELGKFDEAEALLVPSLEIISAQYGGDDRRSVQARQWLIELYLAAGQHEAARALTGKSSP